MITASQISTALGYAVILQISGQSASIDDVEYPAYMTDPEWSEPQEGEEPVLVSPGSLEYPAESQVKPWHQTYVQACFDAGTILPYDEAKAEQLYNWQQAGVPLSVSKPKFFIALHRNHGKKLSDIKTAIDNAITDADANYEAHVELDTCAEIQRDNPLVEAIGKNVWGLTDEQINNVFKLAKSLAS